MMMCVRTAQADKDAHTMTIAHKHIQTTTMSGCVCFVVVCVSFVLLIHHHTITHIFEAYLLITIHPSSIHHHTHTPTITHTHTHTQAPLHTHISTIHHALSKARANLLTSLGNAPQHGHLFD